MGFYRVDLGHAGCQAIRMWNRAADGLSGPDFTAFEFDNLTSLSMSAWFRLGIRLVLTRARGLCALALSSSRFEPTVSVTLGTLSFVFSLEAVGGHAEYRTLLAGFTPNQSESPSKK